MLPVKLNGRLSEEQGEVELGVHLAEAVVRTSAEDEVVLGTLLLRVARVVAVGVELVGPVVDLGVVEGHVGRGDQHAACVEGSETGKLHTDVTEIGDLPLGTV